MCSKWVVFTLRACRQLIIKGWLWSLRWANLELRLCLFWNTGGGAVGVAVSTFLLNNTQSMTRSEMEQFPTVVPCMNKQMINSHMIASDQRITKCFPVMSLSACSVCTVWCKAVVSPRCPSCYTDRDRLCCAWTHEVSEHMEHMAQIHDIWTPTMSTNVTKED